MICLLFGILYIELSEKRSIRRPKKRFADLGTLSNSLATIPTKTFEIGDPYETCAICTEDYAKEDKLRLLLCSHGNNRFSLTPFFCCAIYSCVLFCNISAFHCKCIDQWLANHRRICPLCNQNVVSQQTSVDVV